MPVRATVYGGVEGSLTGSADLGTPVYEFGLPKIAQEFTNGTGSGQVDRDWDDKRTLAASATEDLDLAGVLVNALGATMTFAKIKAIVIKASALNTNTVVVGAGTNPFLGPLGGTTPTIAIPPGGTVVLTAPVAGWTVTPATGDILKVANGGAGTSVEYSIVLLGTSV